MIERNPYGATRQPNTAHHSTTPWRPVRHRATGGIRATGDTCGADAARCPRRSAQCQAPLEWRTGAQADGAGR